MLHAVIMAGGSGTRFWPESRADLPKQLLGLVGERTMLQSTVDRLADLAPPERVLVLTNARLVDKVAEQLPGVPRASILGEPCKRDTAPCIGLAAFRISQHDPEAVMAVMPSDHVISPDAAFQAAIRFAADLVEKAPGRIITFGIRPTYPAESFGYIERGELSAEGKLSEFTADAGQGRGGKNPSGPTKKADGADISVAAYRVKQFREKPKAEVARQYLEAGGFYWNAGIFVWKARTILEALEKYQPEMYQHLATIAAAAGKPNYPAVLEKEFAAIRGVSIDYAVLEHARDILVVEAPFSWDDVGSWQAIARLQGADADGNTIAAKHLGLNTKGTIVRGPDGHLLVTLGVSDCIIVHTPDATLVANKHDEESIRKLVQLIEQNGWQQHL